MSARVAWVNWTWVALPLGSVGGGDRKEAKRRYDGRGSGFGLQRAVDLDDQWDHVTEAQLSVRRVPCGTGFEP